MSIPFSVFPSFLRRYTTAPKRSPKALGARISITEKGRILTHSSLAVDELETRLAAESGVRLTVEAPLARRTTFRIGGPAELLAEVANERALVAVVRAAAAAGIGFELLGLGSNLLVPDEGVRGLVVALTGELKRIRIRGLRVSAGGGAPLPLVARRAAEAGLAGVEALSGFPSTVGGGVFMNAGCYGTEIREVVRSVRLVERDGSRRRVAMSELEPRYRETNLKRSRAVVARALFELRPGERAALVGRIEELNRKRRAALPSGLPNAGSVFKNPPGDYAGRLLEACGMKGRRAGGAAVSERHANVIVNVERARAVDVLALMLAGRTAVAERFGVELEPELVLLGALGDRWRTDAAHAAGAPA